MPINIYSSGLNIKTKHKKHSHIKALKIVQKMNLLKSEKINIKTS